MPALTISFSLHTKIMKKKVIEFKDFSFQYEAQAAPTLRKINLSIYEGEKILIIGASGSGKSTLGKCLNGLIPQIDKGQFSGELLIGKEQFAKASVYDLSLTVGTVLQDSDSQFVGLTVAEDIAFSLENETVPQNEMETAVHYWAKETNLQTYLTKKPQQLSGGEKQRVSIAGVLIDEVPILVFDEPLANLDPATGYRSIQLIDRLYQTQKFTTIIIEHRLEEALAAPIDRVLLMSDGQIVADLTPSELLKSELLVQYGIREPLYITALKKAGVDLEKLPDILDIKALSSPEIAQALLRFQQGHVPKKTIPSQEVLLTIKDVSFEFQKDQLILENLNFTLKKGEMISLVGHNGAGKSTLSNLITGFYQPTKGDILWGKESILEQSIKERAEKIGVVLQNSNQMLSKNFLYDEVALGLRNRQVSEEVIKEKVAATLKICGLYAFRNWPISALSHGQKKRGAIASILVLEPELILLDEPTAGQDYHHYHEMMVFLKELNQRGMTIVMITHDMHLMLEYCHRTLVLKKGRLLADDLPAAVLASERLVQETNLKQTSLYTLAKVNQLPDLTGFVSSFISAEGGSK